MITITEQKLDKERALYHIQDAEILKCTFAGKADGESALKECRHILVGDCHFSLRYPLWHVQDFQISRSDMDTTARAALWYSCNGSITNCTLGGIKCLRECDTIQISGCTVDSPEFGWKCRNIEISDSCVDSEYFMLDSRNIHIQNMQFSGKYSFQYTENVIIEQSVLNTKDAFWHGKNITIRNCIIKGEYLGWYSENLTFENCEIIGTQPLCYCKGLRLINCTMQDTDLAFEYSEVEADICNNILSVKNPKSGHIIADTIGETILTDSIMESTCKISVRNSVQGEN